MDTKTIETASVEQSKRSTHAKGQATWARKVLGRGSFREPGIVNRSLAFWARGACRRHFLLQFLVDIVLYDAEGMGMV